MNTHFLFFIFFIFFCFIFFYYLFIFLRGWAGQKPSPAYISLDGLSSAHRAGHSPARSLAQPSDPAGQKLKARVTCSRVHEHW